MMKGDIEVKEIADLGSFGLVVGSLADWLPQISAVLAILWMLIRIYESRLMQSILPKFMRLPEPKQED